MDHDEEVAGTPADAPSVPTSGPDPAPDQLASDGDDVVEGIHEETTVTETVEQSAEVTQPDEA